MRLSIAALALKVMLAVGVLLPLAGCGSVRTKPSVSPLEAFDATDRFSRVVALEPDAACEAARLALLSQGYLVTAVQPHELRGRKNFQSASAGHVEMEIRVVCAATAGQGEAAHRSTVFVSALQERFELKKSSNSASVGVGAIGSLSLPFAMGNDSMIKVASETVTAPRFYDRFFEVLDRYLETPSKLPSDAEGSRLRDVSEF